MLFYVKYHLLIESAFLHMQLQRHEYVEIFITWQNNLYFVMKKIFALCKYQGICIDEKAPTISLSNNKNLYELESR